MRVIIDIPAVFINGVAGMFAMQSPNDAGEIMAAMEKCQQIDEMELSLNSKDDNQLKMVIAALALCKVAEGKGDKQ